MKARAKSKDVADKAPKKRQRVVRLCPVCARVHLASSLLLLARWLSRGLA